MIDLHTHTTASDGRCRPDDLVSRASAAGVTVLSVTDHDTVGGCAEAAAACLTAGVAFVAGIEMTAVHRDVDIHVLGYFIDVTSPALHAFLTAQRQRRIERVRSMIDKLAALGIRLDADAILKPAIDDPTKSAGRPWIARALVAGGHAATVDEAFGRWLDLGKPAFVARTGPSPEEVIERVHEAWGVASLAHPGPKLIARDAWLEPFVAAGLDAIEAYHPKHTPAIVDHYLELAAELGVAVTGGSDYHGDDTHGAGAPGAVALPREAYERLARWATMRATASGSRVSS